jgi:predicted O-methyltransferase YrrM
LWLSLAAQYLNKKLTTFELDPKEIALANETFTYSRVDHLIDLISGNVLDHLPNYQEISFCFLDNRR